jgi:two-component system CheB/CheR fusion protein
MTPIGAEGESPMTRENRPPKDEIVHRPDQFEIVGIGASAGGLDAFCRFFDAMPADSGMAFILVQHLDPTHKNLLPELLSGHTKMKVCLAAEGMPIAPNSVYVTPSGACLSLNHGLFRISVEGKGHGVRLPFDSLLRSIAELVGNRAIGVVLSGAGADGSAGLRAIKKNRGSVIAQDPDESEFDGMPRSAIETGLVDRVLPVAQIPDALISLGRRLRSENHPPQVNTLTPEGEPDLLMQIVGVLGANSLYDFTPYKRGTLTRQVERRIAMLETPAKNMEQYLGFLKENPAEVDSLAKSMLINVTNFFRDENVFNLLANEVVPKMIENAKPGIPLRLWSIGCSSGEEIYSLIIIFMEQIALSGHPIKLRVFASDIDPDAIRIAREGYYPRTIAADVTPERLTRFFTFDGKGYRIKQEVRNQVIFAVQDILLDPPFSRIDMVSCRNLLIYLLPEAQAKVISLLEFALNDQGVLLLGASETLGSSKELFEPVFSKERIYRRARVRPAQFPDTPLITDRNLRPSSNTEIVHIPPRHVFLADICRRLVLEFFAPASVLIDVNQQCIFTLGPTEPYLGVFSGHSTKDVLAIAHADIRSHLREAISRGENITERIVVEGGRVKHGGRNLSFHMTVQPVQSDGERFLLICFIENPVSTEEQTVTATQEDSPLAKELEKERAAHKIELKTALDNIQMLNEAHATINAEALSANAEFQATNEELLTSKEEMQSLNDELSALNAQLMETLERQRQSSSDLQNVLSATNVPTIFLDVNLNIRFFTPVFRKIFKILESDIGRPLSDLNPLTADRALLEDARSVLRDSRPRQLDIRGPGEQWFNRSILPYLTEDGQTNGVVITFHDISEQKDTNKALQIARYAAELSTTSKSQLLAAASHDLRQPLQTLLLLHHHLEPIVKGRETKQIVARIGTTLDSISGMLNALLDINRIDTGVIPVELKDCRLESLFKRLGNEFNYHAEAKGLELRVVPCRQHIVSDLPLLEQILRNLLSNAIKYTVDGKILLGCRRKGDKLRIQIIDTGVGIDRNDLNTIFDEYHQLNTVPNETERGLGLGLAIVKRLTTLLGHHIEVASWRGKGTVFSLSIDLAGGDAHHQAATVGAIRPEAENETPLPPYNIVLIDDEPEVLALLEVTLKKSGHNVWTAPNEVTANRILAAMSEPPDIIIADYNLTNRINGLLLAKKFRDKFDHSLPIIILTGDISTNVLRQIAQENCLHFHKPIRPGDLEKAMLRLVRRSVPRETPTEPPRSSDAAVISIVEDDDTLGENLRNALKNSGFIVNLYSSSEMFLQNHTPGDSQCLILDAYLPGMGGIELLHHLNETGGSMPTIIITGLADPMLGVNAMKAGAIDFIEKPINLEELRESISRGLNQSQQMAKRDSYLEDVAKAYANLTERQVEVMELVLAGLPSKNIAADLGISQRTVENHRAAIMKKTRSNSLPALARFGSALAKINNE